MRRLWPIGIAIAFLSPCLPSLAAGSGAPDLILYDANIWTVDPVHPTAQAVAIRGDKIQAVGRDTDILRLKTARTTIIDLKQAMLLPGFTDAHTHFGNAVDAFFTARVIDVSTEAELDKRLSEAAARVPADMWITASDLDGNAAAQAKRNADPSFRPFIPDLASVDAAAAGHPVLIRRYDGAYFANSLALKPARLTSDSPNPANGEYVKDGAHDALTGLLLGSAGTRFAALLPPPSRARDAVAAAALMRDLNAMGLVGIHDVARIDALSQKQLFAVDVERSFTNMDIFADLRKAGKLTLRIYPLLSLAEWRDYKAAGITPGAGDTLIRYGALKAFVDASYMSRPFDNGGNWRGDFSYRVTDPALLRSDIIGADRLGFDIALHVMGDQGHQIALDDYQAARDVNPARDRRFRLLHMWFPSFDEIARAGKDHDIADISPYQLIEQLGSIDAALGPERANSAFAWHTAIADGMMLDIGSDWPGSYDGADIAPINPMENIYYAVTRQSLAGTPQDGWHPAEALSVDQAIRAYTSNPAYASHEGKIKGSITPGKLADLVVLSADIRRVPASQIPQTKVLYTIFSGRIVYRAHAVSN